MKTIKKVSAKSLAKLFGLMYAMLGFIFGLFMLVVTLFSQTEDAGVWGIAFGIAAPIVIPLLYGAMGWIGGYIMGWLYNFLATKAGGIQIELEESSVA